MNTLVYAMFPDERAASRAVETLVDSGFEPEDICVMMREGEKVEQLPVEHTTGVVRGVVVGAILGAVGGALAAASAGALIARVTIAPVDGALVGGVAGIVVGIIGGLGYWKDEVHFPRGHAHPAAILVGASAEGRLEEAQHVLERLGAKDIHVRTREQAVEEALHAGV